jgi:isopentenyldiphosphate isomerase
MDELIDILTSEGEPTGKTALKSEAHKNGWFHATVHVWIYMKEHKILLQKRAMTKKVFPGLWDISVAGHIGAGESILNGAKREVKEELGIDISDSDLTKIGSRTHQVLHPNGIQDNEIHHVFIYELKHPIESLQIQTEEVDEIQLFELETLRQTKNLDNVLLPRFHDYYCTVFDKIQQKLNS